MEALVMRAMGASANRPRVSAGRASWASAALKRAISPASRLSMRKKRVTGGGGAEKASRRPRGAGTQPRR